MRKIINSDTRNYEEQVTDTLVLDAVPTVNSFNGVTSDGVARAVAGASGEVPQVTESDNGKVLKAVYDEGGPAVEWGTGPTVDQTYNAESTNAQSGVAVAEAIGAVNAVPASTGADEGKVLTVDNVGSAAWATPAAPTVDQTYNAASTNAQSGVAVAEAIGAVLPSLTGNAGKVLAVNSGATGTEWVSNGTTYENITTGTANITTDNTVVTSTADITSVTVGAAVKQAVVQWAVSSTTTLPTVVDASSNPLKAASNNPSALTVGKTYQLSIINGCYVIAEFA